MGAHDSHRRQSSEGGRDVQRVAIPVVEHEGTERVLAELAQLAAHVVEPPASLGITVSRNGQPFTVANSDGRAARVDETQYEVGEGPCLESLRTGAVVNVPDQGSDRRWGAYAQRASEHGVCSSLTLPLTVNRGTAGALNLYDFDRPHAFDQHRQYAEIFAAQGSTALTLVMRQGLEMETHNQLEQALTSRTVIDQALGILMAQQRCTADEAFTLLREHSQNSNRKLHAVAAELVTRVSGQPPGEPRTFQRSASSDRSLSRE